MWKTRELASMIADSDLGVSTLFVQWSFMGRCSLLNSTILGVTFGTGRGGNKVTPNIRNLWELLGFLYPPLNNTPSWRRTLGRAGSSYADRPRCVASAKDLAPAKRVLSYLAQRVPSLSLASSFRLCLNRDALKGMLPWRTGYPWIIIIITILTN